MKTRSEHFLFSSKLPSEIVAEGMTRQIMGYDGQLMLVKVLFKKGAVGSDHTHYHSQSTYVASGRFEVMIDGEKHILQAGDGYYVAPDTNHGCICLEEGVLIDTFSPMRHDFLG